MDFLRRDGQVNHAAGHAVNVEGGGTHHGSGKANKGINKWLRWASVVLLFSVTILVAALLLSLVFGGPKAESKYVDSSKLQAVFLNGGQVYFGDITSLNEKYMHLNNIYYLRVNQTVQPKNASQTANNDISLVKLGCELHGPDDAMVINRDQIIFWENLKTDGQVAKAVAAFVKQNPDGQKCSTTNTTPSNSNSTNGQ